LAGRLLPNRKRFWSRHRTAVSTAPPPASHEGCCISCTRIHTEPISPEKHKTKAATTQAFAFAATPPSSIIESSVRRPQLITFTMIRPIVCRVPGTQ
jgi:hypothetical protein